MSRTCSEADGGAASGGGGIMLFGVRLTTEGTSSFIRKSASMNNLAQYEQPQDSNPDVAAGYASDDVVHASGQSRERKRGVPWTEEEHMLFLLGLQKVGKGDWRGISRNFVKTRTPTQVASHAQKYFLRRNNHNRRRRRSSLFDITADAVMSSAIKEGQVHQETIPPPPLQHLSSNLGGFPVVSPVPVTLAPAMLIDENLIDRLSVGQTSQVHNLPTKLIKPIPILPIPPSSKMADLKLSSRDPFPLSLKLPNSTPPSDQKSQPAAATTHASAFQAMTGSFSSSSGDSIISVA